MATAPTVPWAAAQLGRVVRTHSARVYRLAFRLTGNRTTPRTSPRRSSSGCSARCRPTHPGTFEGWLHRITTNLFLDLARRRQRIRFDALPDDAAERVPGREPSPAQAYDDNNFDDDVQAALDALPPDFRAAVVLCDIEGLSYEEIAATLGVKLGTVRSRIHRGRAQLREALAHRMPTRPAAQAAHAAATPAAGAEAVNATAAGSSAPHGPVRVGKHVARDPGVRTDSTSGHRPEDDLDRQRPEAHPAGHPAGGGGSVW